MNRLLLLALQLGVAVIGLAVWHVLTVYPVLGQPKQIQFFFSTPLDVLARVAREVATPDLWRHIEITLRETVLAFVFNLDRAMADGITQPVVDVPAGARFDENGRATAP